MADAGVALDAARTRAAALAVGRDGPLPGRVWSWAHSFLSRRTADVRVQLDEPALRQVIADLDLGPRDAPVEPSIRAKGRSFTVVAGRPGSGIDPRAVAKALPDAVAAGGPVTVDVHRGTVPPRFTSADARRLAERAQALTAKPLRVRAGGHTANITAATLRGWLTTRAGDTALELAVDRSKAVAGLAKLVPSVGRPAADAGFSVSGGTVSITPARDGTECCAESALRSRPPHRTDAAARALGIREQVSSFTTHHKCCEARVRNIHRIADILRGYVIPPGATFSVNAAVGKRTTAKGFVSAPVIENGQHSEDVGGGISQFATTTFNAAFFAGLDFGEYQSHSLYISRYPYGREATMGYPHPDLQVRNRTPYGILVWPTYTGTSLTVTFYSTKYYASVLQ